MTERIAKESNNIKCPICGELNHTTLQCPKTEQTINSDQENYQQSKIPFKPNRKWIDPRYNTVAAVEQLQKAIEDILIRSIKR